VLSGRGWMGLDTKVRRFLLQAQRRVRRQNGEVDHIIKLYYWDVGVLAGSFESGSANIEMRYFGPLIRAPSLLVICTSTFTHHHLDSRPGRLIWLRIFY
jgi:hypothetical protein